MVFVFVKAFEGQIQMVLKYKILKLKFLNGNKLKLDGLN